jgi:hypothetical protein
MSPYSIAATAAERAKRSAQLPAAARIAYARRVAFRALRAACPCLTAAHAWFVARTAANAHTVAYFSA